LGCKFPGDKNYLLFPRGIRVDLGGEKEKPSSLKTERPILLFFEFFFDELLWRSNSLLGLVLNKLNDYYLPPFSILWRENGGEEQF
jgi:hypothetical protein